MSYIMLTITLYGQIHSTCRKHFFVLKLRLYKSIAKYCHYGKLFSLNCITLCVIYFMRHYFATELSSWGKKIIFRLMYSKRANKLTLLKFIKIYAYLFILASKTSRVCFHPEATYAFNLYLGHIFDINLHFTLQIQIEIYIKISLC